MNDTVHALVVHDGDLVVGGRFTEADGVSVDHIARWDGNRWSPLSDGPTAGSLPWPSSTAPWWSR